MPILGAPQLKEILENDDPVLAAQRRYLDNQKQQTLNYDNPTLENQPYLTDPQIEFQWDKSINEIMGNIKNATRDTRDRSTVENRNIFAALEKYPMLVAFYNSYVVPSINSNPIFRRKVFRSLDDLAQSADILRRRIEAVSFQDSAKQSSAAFKGIRGMESLRQQAPQAGDPHYFSNIFKSITQDCLSRNLNYISPLAYESGPEPGQVIPGAQPGQPGQVVGKPEQQQPQQPGIIQPTTEQKRQQQLEALRARQVPISPDNVQFRDVDMSQISPDVKAWIFGDPRMARTGPIAESVGIAPQSDRLPPGFAPLPPGAIARTTDRPQSDTLPPGFAPRQPGAIARASDRPHSDRLPPGFRADDVEAPEVPIRRSYYKLRQGVVDDIPQPQTQDEIESEQLEAIRAGDIETLNVGDEQSLNELQEYKRDIDRGLEAQGFYNLSSLLKLSPQNLAELMSEFTAEQVAENYELLRQTIDDVTKKLTMSQTRQRPASSQFSAVLLNDLLNYSRKFDQAMRLWRPSESRKDPSLEEIKQRMRGIIPEESKGVEDAKESKGDEDEGYDTADEGKEEDDGYDTAEEGERSPAAAMAARTAADREAPDFEENPAEEESEAEKRRKRQLAAISARRGRGKQSNKKMSNNKMKKLLKTIEAIKLK